MPLVQQIANTVYDGVYSMLAGQVGQVNVGLEVAAVRAIPPNQGYVNLSWSAAIIVQTNLLQPAFWSPILRRALCTYGWYEIRYGITVMSRHPIDSQRVGVSKITGVSDGVTENTPGDTYVVGNGGSLISVNIGSDRPHRGDVIRYYLRPGVTGLLRLAVNTGFVDNPGGTNKYIINP